MKKTWSIGVASKTEDLGIREELWTDGEVHQVHAYRGIDRRVWIRFWPNPAIGVGKRIFPRRRGK